MGFKSNSFKYQPVWRANNEALCAGVFVFCTSVLFLQTVFSYPPKYIIHVVFACNISFGGVAVYLAWNNFSQNKRLEGVDISFIGVPDTERKRKLKGVTDKINIGTVYAWEQEQAQKLHDLLNQNYQSGVKDPNSDLKMGLGWLHGLGVEEEYWLPVKHLEGHTLITGNPGTGKTRFFDLIINQCIMRGESVIIIDPKGDADLREKARLACIAAGHEDDFFIFHPAFPEQSVAIDPLKNYKETGELASRISALMPKGGASEAFTQFSWRVINTICQTMLFLKIQPSLVKLARYLESGIEPLVVDAVTKVAEDAGLNEYGTSYKENLQMQLNGSNQNKNDRTRTAVTFYHDRLEKTHYHPEVSAIISIYEHPREHYAKMVVSLQPILQVLTSGPLKYLLSPDDSDSRQQSFNLSAFLKEQKVLCIGLNSLRDELAGRMVGSLLLADLTAVAGEIFNTVKPKDMQPINIFVDEVCEVLNDPFVQLLNKGRGAGIRLFVATQSISDFAAKTGGKDRANQILGNINNKFAFRTLDEATQKYLSDHMPKTTVKYLVRSHGVGGRAGQYLSQSGHSEERLMEKEYPLCPPQLFAMLPNLEYVAFISGGKTLKGRIPIIVDDEELLQKKSVKPIPNYILASSVDLLLAPEIYVKNRWTRSLPYRRLTDPMLKECL